MAATLEKAAAPPSLCRANPTPVATLVPVESPAFEPVRESSEEELLASSLLFAEPLFDPEPFTSPTSSAAPASVELLPVRESLEELVLRSSLSFEELLFECAFDP